eukprot:maker-scaffold_76-snap-gene-0.87-mRNA-1 protein AED:0.71 eAED:0.71 QI:0/0/0/0.66/0/0/3/0/155
MQADSSERNKKLLEKRVVPMMLFSGKFQDSQVRWGIVHKELYPTVKTFSRFSYLLPFHPTPIQGHFKKGGVLTLQQADIELHHVKGEDNVFVDMLSRWAATPEREKHRVEAIRVMRAALRREKSESDISLGPKVSMTSNEKNYFRKMFKHPREIR